MILYLYIAITMARTAPRPFSIVSLAHIVDFFLVVSEGMGERRKETRVGSEPPVARSEDCC